MCVGYHQNGIHQIRGAAFGRPSVTQTSAGSPMSALTRSVLHQQRTRLEGRELQRHRQPLAPPPVFVAPPRPSLRSSPTGPVPLTKRTAAAAFDLLSPKLKDPTALEAGVRTKFSQQRLQDNHERSPSHRYAGRGPIQAQASSQREKVRTTQIHEKRAKEKKRQAMWARSLRRSVGLPGLLETISLGRSERDYRLRLDTLVSFAPRLRLEMHPASHLDSTLCEYCDHRYLDGEVAAHGEKLRAFLSALQPEWIGHRCSKVPRFMRSLRGWKRAAPGRFQTPIPEAVSYAISGIMIRRGQDEMALFNRALFSTYLRPGGLMAIMTLDVLDAPPAVSYLKFCQALIVSP